MWLRSWKWPLVHRKAVDQGSEKLWQVLENPCAQLAEVEALINEGADVNSKSWDGLPLHRALSEEEVARYKSFKTPLSHAVANNNLELVKLLLKEGADVTILYCCNRTIVHKALLGARIRGGVSVRDFGKSMSGILEVLAEAGASVEDRDPHSNETPLHLALEMLGGISLPERQSVQAETAQSLLSLGANIESTNSEKLTPLDLATRDKNVVLLRILLEHGADIGAAGNTPANKKRKERSAVIADMFTAERASRKNRDIHRARCAAFAAGLHPRLGARSSVMALDPEVLRMILDDPPHP
jgi:ankyrin repeat protein